MRDTEEGMLPEIRRRDSELGEHIPSHWQGPSDRRILLAMVDRLTLALIEAVNPGIDIDKVRPYLTVNPGIDKMLQGGSNA